MLDLTTLTGHKLSSTSKGVPDVLDGVSIDEVPKRGLNVLKQEFPAPVAVLRQSALRANIDLMRRYTQSVDVELAPHGKTTMAPQLFDMQLAAGAWGITCATSAHLRLYRRFGVPRIVMANQLLDADSVQFVARQLAEDPGFEFYGIVDSVAGACGYFDVLSKLPRSRPVNLLLEVGAPGGRTGLRTVDDAIAVAREIVAMSAGGELRLAGIEGFEGIFAGSPREAETHVSSFMERISEIARRLDTAGSFAAVAREVILTAGGSAHFDQVVKALKAIQLSRPTKVVLRSGCYITHDHGVYATAVDRLRERSVGSVFAEEGFQPALELWTQVQSVPETGLAIIALGKRDVSFDMGLPVPLLHLAAGAQGPPVSFRGRAEIVRLNDHHGYLRFTDVKLAVGDRVAVGISHPCTTFDRWEYLYVVNDRYDVVSVVRTFF